MLTAKENHTFFWREFSYGRPCMVLTWLEQILPKYVVSTIKSHHSMYKSCWNLCTAKVHRDLVLQKGRYRIECSSKMDLLPETRKTFLMIRCTHPHTEFSDFFFCKSEKNKLSQKPILIIKSCLSIEYHLMAGLHLKYLISSEFSHFFCVLRLPINVLCLLSSTKFGQKCYRRKCLAVSTLESLFQESE